MDHNEANIVVTHATDDSSALTGETSSGFFDRMRNRYGQKEYNLSLPMADSNPILQLANLREDLDTNENTESSPVPETTQDRNDDLSSEAKRTLVSLLRHGVILQTQKRKLFEILCRYQGAIRKHLANVYLALVLDERAGIGFICGMKNEADTPIEDFEEDDFEDGEPISLINSRRLSIYDTILLLVLRKHYQERETSGEQKITIDIEHIASYLAAFLPLTNSTKSERRQLESSLQKMTKKKIIRPQPGSDDRYEITPVIRYVVNADFLESMLVEYQRIANEHTAVNTIENAKSE